MIIYMATNKINGKKYIGMTTWTLEDRKKSHRLRSQKKTKYNSHFNNAIRKYGFDAFEWEEIDNAMFIKDLEEKEKYWIEYYDTYYNGYNSTLGGEGANGANRKGEKATGATITDQQALKIIELLKEGKMSFPEIAKATNATFGVVAKINTGHAWSHLYEGDCPSKAGRKPVERIVKGSSHPCSIVTEEQVIEIKRLLSKGMSMRKVAEIMNVNRSLIINIKSGNAWGWLKTPYDDKVPTQPKTKLNEKQVREIKKLLKEGLTQQKIADRFNVVQTVISHINTNKTWKHVQ